MKTKHISWIILLFLIQIFSCQEDQNINKEESSLSSDDSTLNENNFPETSSDSVPTITIKNNINTPLPEAKVILPIRRIDTSLSQINIAPCGGVIRKEADTLTNKGSNIHVIWETITPSNGNCTVKISPGLDDESKFTSLYPVNYQSDENGAFVCGRVKGFEALEFALPEDYVCDKCTIQWKWSTPAGTFYSCSDIIINGMKIEDCLAKCKNGGACFNGKCICEKDFYGDYCQYGGIKAFLIDLANESSNIGWILLVLVFLVVLGLVVYYFYNKVNVSLIIVEQRNYVSP